MKVVRAKVKTPPAASRSKVRLHAHAAFMYRHARETRPVDLRLVKRPQAPVRLLVRRVGEEAARLSIQSRGVISRREVAAALQQLGHMRAAVPTVGA